MAQPLQHAGTETYYIVILLLLSYVMSSAPRFLRDYRNIPAMETPSPTPADWKKILNAYTIQPYKNAWKQLHSNRQIAYFPAQ